MSRRQSVCLEVIRSSLSLVDMYIQFLPQTWDVLGSSVNGLCAPVPRLLLLGCLPSLRCPSFWSGVALVGLTLFQS